MDYRTCIAAVAAGFLLSAAPAVLAAENGNALDGVGDNKVPGTSGPRIDPPHCFDFSRLNPETRYVVGDILATRKGDVRLRDYRRYGAWSESDNQHAIVHNGRIADGETPELRIVQINPVVELDEPASMIKLKFAENSGGTGTHNNLVINNVYREVDGSFETLDGAVLTNRAGNRTRVSVTMANDPSETGDWHAGELRLTALDGKTIRKVGVGGLQFMLDDMCIYDNVVIAPPVARTSSRSQTRD